MLYEKKFGEKGKLMQKKKGGGPKTSKTISRFHL